MKVIGLCGGSGSGKGSVCQIFSELSVTSIDTDAVYHRLTSSDSECLRELVREFGDEILDTSGGLDRSVLRDVVFSSENAKQKRDILNCITHRHILDEARRIIAQKRSEGAAAIIVDAPLLYESGFDKECDVTVCVIADEDIRIQRIVERDGISEEDAIKRIKGQMMDEELLRRADYVIVNNCDFESLRSKVLEISKKILN